jgi:hypothetical protein
MDAGRHPYHAKNAAPYHARSGGDPEILAVKADRNWKNLAAE